MKKEKKDKKEKNVEKNKAKLSEKISLNMRKKFLVSKVCTFFIIIDLIIAFIGINLIKDAVDLPEIDVTANKIYTLSDASKDAISKIDQEIKIYLFGIEETDSVVGLVKQYCSVNSKISYEMLSSDSNLEKVKQYELEDGYSIVVIESGESSKIIDASSEFSTYDYTTYETIDTTEQTLTNSILALSSTNKPKVYFVTGHNEYDEETLGTLTTYLKNESIDYDSIDLMTQGCVPEDCNVLAIMSPSSDYLENETQYITDYINKGGNILFTQDVLEQSTTLPNLQKILDLYGVSVENGYIEESGSSNTASSRPYIFKPQISSSNSITSDISTSSYMWLRYAEKLNFASDEELENLNVTKEDLLTTTEDAEFITDISSDNPNVSETGEFVVSALLKKTISDNSSTDESDSDSESESDTDSDSENETDDDSIVSELIIIGNGTFITDYIASDISSTYPMSYLGSNKDFAINAIAYLGNKDNGLTIRKNMSSTSYVFTATKAQNRIVLAIIFIIPIAIMVFGICVGKYRKKRK